MGGATNFDVGGGVNALEGLGLITLTFEKGEGCMTLPAIII